MPRCSPIYQPPPPPSPKTHSPPPVLPKCFPHFKAQRIEVIIILWLTVHCYDFSWHHILGSLYTVINSKFEEGREGVRSVWDGVQITFLWESIVSVAGLRCKMLLFHGYSFICHTNLRSCAILCRIGFVPITSVGCGTHPPPSAASSPTPTFCLPIGGYTVHHQLYSITSVTSDALCKVTTSHHSANNTTQF